MARRTPKMTPRQERDEARAQHARIMADIEARGVTLANRCPDWVAGNRHSSHSWDEEVKIHCPGWL